jgi:hypothetical protein
VSSDEPEIMPTDVAVDILLGREVTEIPENVKSMFDRYEEDGKSMLVKKSTLMWRLTSKKFHLSTDRKLRVTEAEHSLLEASKSSVSQVVVIAELHQGDWCIFKNSPVPNHFYVGRILGFSYLSGKGSARVYSSPSAPVVTPEDAGPRGFPYGKK